MMYSMLEPPMNARYGKNFLFLTLDQSTTPDAEHGGDTLEEFLAKVDRLHWTEELRSMYKQKYGLF